MNPGNVALVRLTIRSFVNRERKTQHVENALVQTIDRAADALHHAVAGGGGVAFTIVHHRDCVGNFRVVKKYVCKTASEFAGWPVVVHRWILNIRVASRAEKREENKAEEDFHK